MSLLVIAVLLLSIFSPIVEASVVYGPSQFRGDWYSGAITNKPGNAVSSDGSVIVNGSSSIVNGSKVANGSPAVGALPSTNSNNVNPSVVYSTQYSYAGSNTGALGDYERVMGQYCPEVQLDGTGGVKVSNSNNKNSQKNGLAGSNVVFQYLDNYVQTDNFSMIAPHGNYTLYLRNGDSSGKFVKNGTIFYVRLNGKDVFTPLDFSLTNQVLKKNVTVLQNDRLQVFAVGLPGSYLTLWLEDESPDIVITSPMGDTVSNGTITLAGYITDHNVKTVTVKQSNNITVTSVPVSNGNFSTSLYIHAPVKLTLSETDSTGTPRTTSLCLDGDYLPMQAELQYGFDPLKPDSDSKLTATNESMNGIPDGFEILGNQSGEKLPAFVKALVGGDPLKVDSNGNGLSDYFELVKLGDIDVGVNSSAEIALPGADPDKDGLTNLQEQSLGTDPLVADTDHDGLNDGYETNVSHTNPLSKDSDNDGLQDDSELKVGTDPNNKDSNGNGILDGNETYTTTASNSTLGVSVAITGKGDISKNLTFYHEPSDYYNISSVISPLVDIGLDGSFNSAVITMKYDPALVSDTANLSLAYFNESLGLYVPVKSQVDLVNHTVSANTTHFSMWAILDTNALMALYKQISDFNHEAYYGNAVGIPTPGDNLTVPYDSSLIVTFVEGDTAYNDQFGLWSPVKRSLGTAHGTSPGTVYNLGNYTNGTSLTFYLVNDPGNTWLSGPGTMNPDGVAHAYIKPISDDTYNLGWEDLYGGGDRDYNDVILNITFVRSTADTDGDGLPDYLETHGIMDNLGHTYVMNATNPDTDGDGLTDDKEVGVLKTNANGYIQYCFNVISNPMLKDSDGDGLNDSQELQASTLPFVTDTDHDGLVDGIDPDPLVPLVQQVEEGALEMARALVLGAVFGQSGVQGGLCYGIVGNVSTSVYYVVGWFVFSLIPIADSLTNIRDAAQCIVNGDSLNAALYSSGIVLSVVDLGALATATGAVAVFIKLNPSKTGKLLEVLVDVLKVMPDSAIEKVLRVFDNGAIDSIVKNIADKGGSFGKVIELIGKGYGLSDLKFIAENNGCIDKTIGLVKRDNTVKWLEEGTTSAETSKPAGWAHIFEDHIKDYNGPDNDFANALGSQYRSAESIQGLIYESIQKGTMDTNDVGAYYYKVTNDKAIETVVGSNGYIVTSYPIPIKEVPFPL